MMEDTQAQWKRFQQSSWLRDWTQNIVNFQNSAIQQQREKFNAEKDNQMMDTFSESINATSHWVSQECNKAFRKQLVAKWLRDYFWETQWIDYSNVEDVPLVDWFIRENPNTKTSIYDFILDDNQVCDPTQLYYDIWIQQPEEVVTPEEESDMNPLLKAWVDAAWAVTESILWIPKFLWKEVADFDAWTIKLFWWDEERANKAAEDVKSFIDNLSFWDESSRTYKWTKLGSDLILAYLLWRWMFGTNIGNLWLGTKSLLWAAEWATDMALYSMISDSELPSNTDLDIWMWLWWILPYWWLLFKWAKKMLNKAWQKEIEKSIYDLTKLTESQQDKFLKEFWEVYTEWMKSKWLTTYDDVINYRKEISKRKNDALKAIKWKYQSPEVEDVLNEVVEYARRTKDPNLEKLENLLNKYNTEWWLDMPTIDYIKQYFEFKRNFAYDETLASEVRDTLTNMDTALREWQRWVAKENWLDILADLNEEKRILYFLKEKAKDMTKIWKNGMTFKDFFVAMATGNFKWAMSYLFTKDILNSPTFKKYYANILKKLFKSGSTDELIVDFEKIQNIQDEKEFLKWIKENWLDKEALPEIEWAVNDAGKKRIIDNDTFIGTPDWKLIKKDKVTELPKVSNS